MGVNPSACIGKPEQPVAFKPPLPGEESPYRKRAAAQLAGVDTSRFPVDSVNWSDSMAFCARLAATPEEHRNGAVYRLPTEAQWEYACRAGTTTAWYHGDDPGLFDEVGYSYQQTSVMVGQRRPNAWDLYDMCGSIYQWCADHYAADYYVLSPPVDPTGPANGPATLRGSAANISIPFACRSATRRSMPSHTRAFIMGFRVVCEIPALACPNRGAGSTGN